MKNRGMITYFVLVLIAFLALFLSNISILSQGEINQLAKSEAVLKADIAARSTFNAFAWKLKGAGFEARPCLTSPVDEISTSNDVVCELLCYDSEGEERSVDIWILAKSAAATRALFYRVKFIESLIGRFNRTVTIYSDAFPVEDFPTNRVSPKTPQKILALLAARAENLKKCQAISKSLEDSRDAGDALKRLGMNTDGKVLGTIPPLTTIRTEDGKSQSLPTMLAVRPAESDGRELLTLSSLKKSDVAMQLEKATQVAGNVLTTDPSASVSSTKDNPPANTRTTGYQRWVAYNAAAKAINKFGSKNLFGNASEEDKQKAAAALAKYLAVSKNGIASWFLSSWMKRVENDYEKDKAKDQARQGGKPSDAPPNGGSGTSIGGGGGRQ